ncbi:hypothetical protein C7M84_023491 [Penaeus vannamei]|uniref:small monomeric GTPase n=1 Tax=Penaeus vannamei TaxID=6689 RepID=A0A3R7MJF0_PENVA|nr:hypothetical protein C7M84_023491 [Penaeus vannamei]
MTACFWKPLSHSFLCKSLSLKKQQPCDPLSAPSPDSPPSTSGWESSRQLVDRGSFLIWDVGGQEKIRPLWRSYTRCTDGIVFVVDSVDIERLEEARCELHKTARLPENMQVPILVLANKQDLPGAKDPQEIERLLGIAELGNTHLWHIQPACAITGEGLDEALENLYEMIHKQRRLSKTSKKKPR